MDPTSISGISSQDNLLMESDFSAVLPAGMDSIEMAEKIQTLEAKLLKHEKKRSFACWFVFVAFMVVILFGCYATIRLVILTNRIEGVKKENKNMSRELREVQEKEAVNSGTLVNLTERIADLEGRYKLDLIKMKENKWNAADCGPTIFISDGGRVVTYSGPTRIWNGARAKFAIPKFNLNSKNGSIIYLEVEILAIPASGGIQIGFCTQQFRLESNGLGNGQNSIGIWNKGGIFIDGTFISFENAGGYFQAGDVIGIGIAHFSPILPVKCVVIVSYNGQLLGMVDLPSKFVSLQLFPAVNLYFDKESIRANFGESPFRYNPREIL